LKLREAAFEIQRTDDSKKRPGDFKAWMKKSEKLAAELEDTLRGSKQADELDALLLNIQNNCTACHKIYRNVPQK
jgi:cytochrome c556